jgi:hypothetical protein
MSRAAKHIEPSAQYIASSLARGLTVRGHVNPNREVFTWNTVLMPMQLLQEGLLREAMD